MSIICPQSSHALWRVTGNATWLWARTRPTCDVFQLDGGSMAIYTDREGGGKYGNNRAAIAFDTSGVTGVVASVTLHLYCNLDAAHRVCYLGIAPWTYGTPFVGTFFPAPAGSLVGHLHPDVAAGWKTADLGATLSTPLHPIYLMLEQDYENITPGPLTANEDYVLVSFGGGLDAWLEVTLAPPTVTSVTPASAERGTP